MLALLELFHFDIRTYLDMAVLANEYDQSTQSLIVIGNAQSFPVHSEHLVCRLNDYCALIFGLKQNLLFF